MDLKLRFPPTPAAMSQHAELAVTAARNVDRVRLDYSVESLPDVDSILAALHADAVSPQQIGETLFAFGAYVGEVIARNATGTWATAPSPMAEPGAWPVVHLPSRERFVDPIGKVFKLVRDGPGESVADFYRALVSSA